MEKTFKITWDDDLGPMWMNIFNLELCLFSTNHIGRNVRPDIKVEEVCHETVPDTSSRDDAGQIDHTESSTSQGRHNFPRPHDI